MQNHEPNSIKQPTPAEIRAGRKSAGLNQTEAAALVFSTRRAWQYWEENDGGRTISLSDWELFLLKTDQHPFLKIQQR
jgi:DNA-binding transcriptional regulator YiaG